MKGVNNNSQNDLMVAVEAINNLTAQELGECFDSGQHVAQMAHDEIDLAPIERRPGIFYRQLVLWRRNLVSALSNSYRWYFKLALAHRHETGSYPDQWAWQAIQPAIRFTLEQLHDWYILACDGENQYVQKVSSGSISFVPGGTVSIPISLSPQPIPSTKSWRAPSWLFQVAPTLGFIRPLKSKHVPDIDSNDKLGAAHSRLVLKLARRVLLWELGASIDKVRNEEIATASATPSQAVDAGATGTAEHRKPKNWLRGIEGLTRKADLSRYKQGLTEKQELAFSLKYEYQIGPTEIAARMGIDRKTLAEHLDAADRKIKQLHSSEKRKRNRAKSSADL